MELSLTDIHFCCHQHSVIPRKVSENAGEIRLENGDRTKSKGAKTDKIRELGYLQVANRQSPVLKGSRNISKNIRRGRGMMTSKKVTYVSPVASARKIYKNQWNNGKKEKEKEGKKCVQKSKPSPLIQYSSGNDSMGLGSYRNVLVSCFCVPKRAQAKQ
jgi:hypothetical protein